MADHSDLFVDVVTKMVKATQEADIEGDAAVAASHNAVREALETMESRVRNILEQGRLDPEEGYEVAFLDDALRKIEEADRRYEVDFAVRAGARRRRDLLKELVAALKSE